MKIKSSTSTVALSRFEQESFFMLKSVFCHVSNHIPYPVNLHSAYKK